MIRYNELLVLLRGKKNLKIKNKEYNIQVNRVGSGLVQKFTGFRV